MHPAYAVPFLRISHKYHLKWGNVWLQHPNLHWFVGILTSLANVFSAEMHPETTGFT